MSPCVSFSTRSCATAWSQSAVGVSNAPPAASASRWCFPLIIDGCVPHTNTTRNASSREETLLLSVPSCTAGWLPHVARKLSRTAICDLPIETMLKIPTTAPRKRCSWCSDESRVFASPMSSRVDSCTCAVTETNVIAIHIAEPLFDMAPAGAVEKIIAQKTKNQPLQLLVYSRSLLECV